MRFHLAPVFALGFLVCAAASSIQIPNCFSSDYDGTWYVYAILARDSSSIPGCLSFTYGEDGVFQVRYVADGETVTVSGTYGVNNEDHLFCPEISSENPVIRDILGSVDHHFLEGNPTEYALVKAGLDTQPDDQSSCFRFVWLLTRERLPSNTAILSEIVDHEGLTLVNQANCEPTTPCATTPEVTTPVCTTPEETTPEETTPEETTPECNTTVSTTTEVTTTPEPTPSPCLPIDGLDLRTASIITWQRNNAGGFAKGNMIDGDNSTYFMSGNQHYQWIRFDLGASYNVTLLQVLPFYRRNGNGPNDKYDRVTRIEAIVTDNADYPTGNGQNAERSFPEADGYIRSPFQYVGPPSDAEADAKALINFPFGGEGSSGQCGRYIIIRKYEELHADENFLEIAEIFVQ